MYLLCLKFDFSSHRTQIHVTRDENRFEVRIAVKYFPVSRFCSKLKIKKKNNWNLSVFFETILFVECVYIQPACCDSIMPMSSKLSNCIAQNIGEEKKKRCTRFFVAAPVSQSLSNVRILFFCLFFFFAWPFGNVVTYCNMFGKNQYFRLIYLFS